MAKKHLAVSIISILIFALIGAGFLFYQIKQAKEIKAGTGHNVYGWAWSENLGWISFNNTSAGGGIDYGVRICTGDSSDPTMCSGKPAGAIVGHVWSRGTSNDEGGIGWLSFNRSETGIPPAAPNFGNYLARVDLATKEISGWARACGIPQGGVSIVCGGDGWDGWIKLRGTTQGGQAYGLSIDDSVSPAEFRGWAWGGDPQGNVDEAVIGWLSFNCQNCEGNSGCDRQATCNGSHKDYKVYTTFTFNRKPTVTGMAQTTRDYCSPSAGLGRLGFEWQYNDEDSDDSELKFHIRVNNVDNVNAAGREIDEIVTDPACIDNPLIPGISCINTYGATVGTQLDYGPTYYWWVNVYDANNQESGWEAGPLFVTASHPWPRPSFTFSPLNPAEGEVVTFTNNSICYGPTCTYYWNFGDGNFSNEFAPEHTYETKGTYAVYLTVTDPTVGSCTGEPPVPIMVSLPKWEEITPY